MLRVLKKRGRLRLKVRFSILDDDYKEWALRDSAIYIRNLGSQGSLLNIVERVKNAIV